MQRLEVSSAVRPPIRFVTLQRVNIRYLGLLFVCVFFVTSTAFFVIVCFLFDWV
jgi:hypothetical protein